MVTEKRIEMIGNNEEREITGSNLSDLIEYSLGKIRSISKDFYKSHLLTELRDKGICTIDHHAGMGTYYIIKLI